MEPFSRYRRFHDHLAPRVLLCYDSGFKPSSPILARINCIWKDCIPPCKYVKVYWGFSLNFMIKGDILCVPLMEGNWYLWRWYLAKIFMNKSSKQFIIISITPVEHLILPDVNKRGHWTMETHRKRSIYLYIQVFGKSLNSAYFNKKNAIFLT